MPQDPDSSIRRRALELVFALMNHNTVRALMREILSFLDVADSELKAYMCSCIATNAQRCASSPSTRRLSLVVECAVAHVVVYTFSGTRRTRGGIWTRY